VVIRNASRVFGESAGGNAVRTLMTVPEAANLFWRAIAQSSPANAIYSPDVTAIFAQQFVELLSEGVDNSSTESTASEDVGELLMSAPFERIVRATTRLQLMTPDWSCEPCVLHLSSTGRSCRNDRSTHSRKVELTLFRVLSARMTVRARFSRPA